VFETVLCDEFFRLGAFAAAGWTKKNQVEHLFWFVV
jgi:hypothetical protein